MDRQLLVDFFRCHGASDSVKSGLGLLISEIIGGRLLRLPYDACFRESEGVVLFR